MVTGDRIKQRRLQLGLNASDVAAKIGKDRATLYRYESSEIEKLPIGEIDPLAEVLHCSPAYLMGWTDEPLEPQAPQLQPQDISLEEINIIRAYRAADDGIKDAVAKLLDVEREKGSAGSSVASAG